MGEPNEGLLGVDVTESLQHFGTPTAEEKRAFTRVLQGHIALDAAVFPNGTTGAVSLHFWFQLPFKSDPRTGYIMYILLALGLRRAAYDF